MVPITLRCIAFHIRKFLYMYIIIDLQLLNLYLQFISFLTTFPDADDLHSNPPSLSALKSKPKA